MLVLLASCEAGVDWAPREAPASLETAGAAPSLVHGRAALYCAPEKTGRDVVTGCTAAMDGRPLAGEARDVRDLGTHIVRLDPQGRVSLEHLKHTSEGEETALRASELARQALAIDADAEGRRVAVVRRLSDDEHTAMPPQELVVFDLEAGTAHRSSRHPLDGQIYLVPGSSELLFVSARTGLASLWLRDARGSERQLTNLGRGEIGPDFVPVPSGPVAWEPGGGVAVYQSTLGAPELFALDLGEGVVRSLGPGSHPRVDDGVVVARRELGQEEPIDVRRGAPVVHFTAIEALR